MLSFPHRLRKPLWIFFRQLRSHMGREHTAAGCRPHWSHELCNVDSLRR
jgi:hypothetical protein